MQKINIPVIIFSLFFLLLTCCSENLEQEVVTTYPGGNLMKVNYYKWVGNEKVIVKEIRYKRDGGKEQEGKLKTGRKHGLWTTWYSDRDEKWMEETFENGIKHGKFKVWYKSGVIQYKGSYNNGIPSDVWTFYDINGDKTKEVTYKDGEKVHEKEY